MVILEDCPYLKGRYTQHFLLQINKVLLIGGGIYYLGS